ncbi:MAG: type IV pilin protein [Thiohalomonadales bacterium]
MKYQRQSGFSLIELMVTLAIVAIIASIAFPSYQASILKSKRSDGQELLLNISARMERALYSDGEYKIDLQKLGFDSAAAVSSPESYYKATVLAATATCPVANCFVVQATPQLGQADDGVMELTSTGIKRRDKNNDGDFLDAGEDSWVN